MQNKDSTLKLNVPLLMFLSLRGHTCIFVLVYSTKPRFVTDSGACQTARSHLKTFSRYTLRVNANPTLSRDALKMCHQ